MLSLKASLDVSSDRVMVETISKILISLNIKPFSFPRQLHKIEAELAFIKKILTGAFHQILSQYTPDQLRVPLRALAWRQISDLPW